MASSSTWFTRSTTGKQHYELPRWRSSSPMTGSIIPPPIVESMYQPAVDVPLRESAQSIIQEHKESNRESELHADLQYLLDAQAESLKSMGKGLPDDATSTGSTTPTARNNLSKRSARPKRKVGLRSARKGIFNCIMALSAVKHDQTIAMQQSLQEREDELAQTERWMKKHERLQQAATRFDDGEESIRTQRLRQEAEDLEVEINEVEARLAELKMKQSRVLKQAAEVEHAVQSKLESYTLGLNKLEADVRSFLNAKGDDMASLAVEKQNTSRTPVISTGIAAARDKVEKERTELEEQLESVQLEESALNEGAKIWQKISSQVTDFEKQLRAEMANLAPNMSDSAAAWDDTPSTSATRMKELHSHLRDIIADLNLELEVAEKKNWKLLVAAISAELEALKHGKLILDGVVEQESERSNDTTNDSGPLLNHTDVIDRSERVYTNWRRSDADDEPDPELLFSVQDDTD